MHGADPSPPFSDEVKNVWSYTTTPPIFFHGIYIATSPTLNLLPVVFCLLRIPHELIWDWTLPMWWQTTTLPMWWKTTSSSSSGPGAYVPDEPQPIGLLCDPCPPRDFRPSHFCCQAPPRPYDARDPSSERWNCGWECWPVIMHKCRFPRYI
jgi:hypothetical protein